MAPQRRVMESPTKYTSIHPFFAFSRSCSWAVFEFPSVRAMGIVGPPVGRGLAIGSLLARALMYRDVVEQFVPARPQPGRLMRPFPVAAERARRARLDREGRKRQ